AHQHVHARRDQLPQGVRGEADPDERRPGVLHHARDARRLRARRLRRAPHAAAGRSGSLVQAGLARGRLGSGSRPPTRPARANSLHEEFCQTTPVQSLSSQLITAWSPARKMFIAPIEAVPALSVGYTTSMWTV